MFSTFSSTLFELHFNSRYRSLAHLENSGMLQVPRSSHFPCWFAVFLKFNPRENYVLLIKCPVFIFWSLRTSLVVARARFTVNKLPRTANKDPPPKHLIYTKTSCVELVLDGVGIFVVVHEWSLANLSRYGIRLLTGPKDSYFFIGRCEGS